VRGGGQQVPVVAVDLLQAGVGRAGEVQGVGRAQKDRGGRPIICQQAAAINSVETGSH